MINQGKTFASIGPKYEEVQILNKQIHEKIERKYLTTQI